MSEYDLVVVGAGHNGLTAAAYFASFGFHVAVVDKNNQVGGGVVTIEVMPGVFQDLHSMTHQIILSNPMIKEDEIGLQRRYGLNYIRQDQILGAAWPDGSSAIWYKSLENTVRNLSRISQKDAAGYAKFIEWAKPIIEPALNSMFEPPTAYGQELEKLESTPTGREAIQIMFANAIDIAEEWFEDDRIKAALVQGAADWSVSNPRTPGTGFALLAEQINLHLYGWAIPRGGSGALSEALTRCIRNNGGDVITDCLVTHVIVEGGTATAVRTKNGNMIRAKKAIVADLNIKQLPQLCGEDKFDSVFLRQVRRLPHGVAGGQLEWVLSDYPRFSADPDLVKCLGIRLPRTLEDVVRTYDGYYYGELQWTQPWISVHTVIDSSRAPFGKHTLNVWLTEPYEIAEGGHEAWDKMKDVVAQRAYEYLRGYAPNMTEDKVLHRYFHSPLDYARWNPSMMNGDEAHIAEALGQSGDLRPIPGYGNFKTPINGLYLCGPSTNVGGGVTGQSRAAVKAILGYLGYDFDELLLSLLQRLNVQS